MRMLATLIALGAVLSATSCLSYARDRHAQVQAAKRSGIPIVVTAYMWRGPNSAGGVDANVWFVNCRDNPIKYARFSLKSYNAVGDVISCDTRGRSLHVVKATGPFLPDVLQGRGSFWSNVIYAHDFHHFEVVSVDLEYMDGKRFTFEGEALAPLLTPSLVKRQARRSEPGYRSSLARDDWH